MDPMVGQEREFDWLVERLSRMWKPWVWFPGHSTVQTQRLYAQHVGHGRRKVILSHIWSLKPAWTTRNPVSEEKINRTKENP